MLGVRDEIVKRRFPPSGINDDGGSIGGPLGEDVARKMGWCPSMRIAWTRGSSVLSCVVRRLVI